MKESKTKVLRDRYAHFKASKFQFTKLLTLSLLLFLGAVRCGSFAAPGDVDLSFDPGSGVTGLNGEVRTVAVQPDGKVIIGGSFSSVQGLMHSCIARLNADGSADSSFDPGTGIQIDNPLASRGIFSVALQPDGKILIGGFFTHVNGAYRTGLARLNANGSLDASFNVGLSHDGDYPQVYSLAVQADGKVLVGGRFNAVNGTSRNAIARLNADGSLDASFSAELTSGLFAVITSLAVQADGKILVAGFYPQDTDEGHYEDYFLVRLNAAGSRDTGFNSETEFANDPFFPMVTSVAVQADGKVLVGGAFTTVNGTNRNGIVRFNVNGSLDDTFNPGTGITGGGDPVVHSVAAQPDGKVLIGGRFTLVNGTNRTGIARLNPNGSLDDSFYPRAGANSIVYSVTLQTDARVFLGGTFSEINGVSRTRIGRLDPDGSLDGSFNPGSGINGAVASLAVQADGKVLIGGHFTTVQEFRRAGIARLHANGSPDSAFDAGLTGDVRFNFGKPVIYSVVRQPDGRVLIGGQFTNVHGVSRNRIARLHADGSLDSSFDPGTGITGSDYPVVTFVVAQPDGKVLVAGSFTSVNGTNRNGIARLNENGSLDNSFNPDLGSTNVVSAVALQSDGKVLVGSASIYRFFDPVTEEIYDVYNYLVIRLNANGSRDASFEPATGQLGPQSQLVNEIAAQSDGKILVGGHFTTFKGSSRNGIGRLNADGSLDTSFNPGTGGAGTSSIVLQPDGKILVGGDGMARLNADGSLDSSFNPAAGPVFSIALQSEGKVLIGGNFTTVNGVARPHVARLYGDAGQPPNLAPTVSISSPADGATYVAPATVDIDVLASDSDGFIARVDFYAGDALLVSDDSPPFEISWENVSPGNYTLTADATDNLGATTTSAEVNIIVTAPTPPPAPSGLTATAVSRKKINLSWTDNATNELGFKIERSTNGKPFKQIATVGANVTTFLNTDLVIGKKYTYRVRAFNAAGDSSYSNTATARTSRRFWDWLPFQRSQ